MSSVRLWKYCTEWDPISTNNIEVDRAHRSLLQIDPNNSDFENLIKPYSHHFDTAFQGYTLIGYAVSQRNMPWIQYLVKKLGKEILNRGDCHYKTEKNALGMNILITCSRGMTALSRVVYFSSLDPHPEDESFIEELIQLGADVNIATCNYLGASKGFVPFSTTPLWIAAEKTGRLSMVKLLRRHGGVANPELSEAGKKLVEQADKELALESPKPRPGIAPLEEDTPALDAVFADF